jgi:hypothetical protein
MNRMSIPPKSAWKTRLVEREFPDRSFDIEFWQEQGHEAIVAAPWEMIELAEEAQAENRCYRRTITALTRSQIDLS